MPPIMSTIISGHASPISTYTQAVPRTPPTASAATRITAPSRYPEGACDSLSFVSDAGKGDQIDAAGKRCQAPRTVADFGVTRVLSSRAEKSWPSVLRTPFYARQLSPPRIPRIPGGSAVAAGKPLINHRMADLSHEHQEQ